MFFGPLPKALALACVWQESWHKAFHSRRIPILGAAVFTTVCQSPGVIALIRKPFYLCYSEISADSIIVDSFCKLLNLYILYQSMNTPTLSSLKNWKCLLHFPLFLFWNEQVWMVPLHIRFWMEPLHIGRRCTRTLKPTVRRPSSKLAFASCFLPFSGLSSLHFILLVPFSLITNCSKSISSEELNPSSDSEILRASLLNSSSGGYRLLLLETSADWSFFFSFSFSFSFLQNSPQVFFPNMIFSSGSRPVERPVCLIVAPCFLFAPALSPCFTSDRLFWISSRILCPALITCCHVKRNRKASNTGESSRSDIPRKAVTCPRSSGSTLRTRDLPCAGVMVVPGCSAPLIPSFCPHRKEHTQDNRNLLWLKALLLTSQEEDPEPRKWCCLYSPQRDVSAPDVAWQLLIPCLPITPLIRPKMGSD
jgi:hypothetical protein